MDFNIENEGIPILSAQMQWDKLPKPVTSFITAVKQAGIRWGGDFSHPDPIHFDSRIDAYGDEYMILQFLNQQSIVKKQPLAKARG